MSIPKVVAGLLAASAIVAPAAAAAPFKQLGRADAAIAFQVKSSVKRWIPGTARNLAVTSVKINGRNPQVADSATQTEYGFGVVVRFFQTGHRFYVRVANATNHPVRIAVTYEFH